MNANSFGKYFGFTAFGESHGFAMGLVIEDIKPGIDFPFDKINDLLQKRRPGKGEFSTTREEKDKPIIVSGVFNGKTTGMPICILIKNENAKPADYEKIKNLFRPGHADYSFFKKFKIYDYRGGGRASGRETISRVVANGMIYEMTKDIEINLVTKTIGEFRAMETSTDFAKTNDLKWGEKDSFVSLQKYLQKLKEIGNSVGGILEIKISNIPFGLGDPVFEKLDANIGKALLSIGSVKGIEFGKGFQFATLTGKEANDEISSTGFLSNNAGGILGGISTGENIILRIVIKPTPSINLTQNTINHCNEDAKIEIGGRHDICIIPRIIPVVDSMLRLVLADAIAHQNLINSKELSLSDLRESIDKIDEDIILSLFRRRKVVEKIRELKEKNSIKNYDSYRENQMIKDRKSFAKEFNISTELIEEMWEVILKYFKKNEFFLKD